MLKKYAESITRQTRAQQARTDGYTDLSVTFVSNREVSDELHIYKALQKEKHSGMNTSQSTNAKATTRMQKTQ